MKLGVIGCGYWGPNLIRNFLATGRCEVQCYDSAPMALDRALRLFPSATPSHSVDEMMDACEAVAVATPVKSHYSLARMALMAGKHVFVEKPLTASFGEGIELVELALRRKVALMTGHTFLYSPAVRKVKQYIREGALGEIFAVSSSRQNLGQYRNDVDVLWDLAPHDLSMLLSWLGEAPSRVAAHGRACRGHLLDDASLCLEFPSGTIATVEVSWTAPNKLRSTLLKGSKRMLLYDDNSANEKLKLYDAGAVMPETPNSFGEYQLTYRTGDILVPRLDATEPLLAQSHAFLDWVEDGTEAEENAWIALQVVATLEAAARSLQEQSKLVEVTGRIGARKPAARSLGAPAAIVS